MRKIWLKKIDSEDTWDLLPQDRNGHYDPDIIGSPLVNIKGMGYKQTITQNQVETEYFISQISTANQPITGIMLFRDDEHIKKFQEWVGDFRNQLYLYYSPSGEYEAGDQISAPFYKKVILTQADKTEMDEFGWYQISTTFSTQDDVWNRDVYYAIQDLSTVGEALVYPYVYPYTFGGRDALAIEFNNDGREVGCIVKIKNRKYKIETTNPNGNLNVTLNETIFENSGVTIPFNIHYVSNAWYNEDDEYVGTKNELASNYGILYTETVNENATISIFLSSNLSNIEWFIDRDYVDYYGVLHEHADVQRSKWNLTLSAGAELTIDSNPLTQEAKVTYTDNTSQSVVDLQEPDWNYINFVRVTHGKNRIVFYIENDNNDNIDITFIYREQRELI